MSRELERMIHDDPDGLDRKKPDEAVLVRILHQVQQAQPNIAPAGRAIAMPWLKWAVAGLLIAATGTAIWYFNRVQPKAVVNQSPVRQQRAETEVVQMPEAKETPQSSAPVTSVAPDTAAPVITIVPDKVAMAVKPVAASRRKVAAVAPGYSMKIKGEEVQDETNAYNVDKPSSASVNMEEHNIWAGLQNMESASGRISVLSKAMKWMRNSEIVIDTLLRVLNDDPNASVRLAALDGLVQFQDNSKVRIRLVAALTSEQDRFVQIALIDALTRLKEPGVVPALENMVKDQNTTTVVKDMAWAGILRLRDNKLK